MLSVFQNLKKATYGSGYKLTLSRSKKEAVLSDAADAIANIRIKNDKIPWYVPHFTPSITQQGILG